jgi:hypothetical protein
MRKHDCGVSLEEIRDAAHCNDMLTLLQQEERHPTDNLTLNSEIVLSGCGGLQQLLDYCAKHKIITLADNPRRTNASAGNSSTRSNAETATIQGFADGLCVRQ